MTSPVNSLELQSLKAAEDMAKDWMKSLQDKSMAAVAEKGRNQDLLNAHLVTLAQIRASVDILSKQIEGLRQAVQADKAAVANAQEELNKAERKHEEKKKDIENAKAAQNQPSYHVRVHLFRRYSHRI